MLLSVQPKKVCGGNHDGFDVNDSIGDDVGVCVVGGGDNMEGLGSAPLCPRQVLVMMMKNYKKLFLYRQKYLKYPGCLGGGMAYPQRGQCLAQRLLFHCSMHSRMRIKDTLSQILLFTVRCVLE